MPTRLMGFEPLPAAWDRAAGLATLREGFAWTPDFDRLFALGWPHLRALVDGHPDDADPAKALDVVIDGSLEGHYHAVWPRQVALRYVRAYGGRDGALTQRNAYVAAAVQAPGLPVDEGEARLMLRDRLRRAETPGEWFVEHFVLLLEAFVGTEAVLDGLTEAFEGEVADKAEAETFGHAIGFLLLRVDEAFAIPRRARLGAVLARSKPGSCVYDGLARSLGGAAAARAIAKNPCYYHHAIDDPAAVVAAVHAGRWLPSPRHVFIGGDRVLAEVAPYWKRQREAEFQRKLALGLAPIRSRRTPRIFAEMAMKSKIKRDLPKILAPFAPSLRPALKALTDDPKCGTGARKLLAALK